MNPLEIVLIIIGIIVILISCRLVDKSQKPIAGAAGRTLSLDNSLTEDDKQQLMKKMEELLSEVTEEIIVKTDDTLSKISNEKIIAVSEFSNQILEKINRNHEEVVFLYNMLSDKEKELKSAVKEIDTTKKKVQDILESKSKNVATTQPSKGTTPTQTVKNVTQADGIEKSVKPVALNIETKQETTAQSSNSSNNNTQILALHAQGKSVMEISKLLDLGQGEVKLVIDLFKGKK